MHVFEVWAPRAGTMEVKIGNNKFPMEKKSRGYWSAAVEEAGPGTDYGFVMDSLEPPLPDPRTQWQPHGVHGESRLVDHAGFAWSDSGWQAPPLSSALIYELHLGTFTPEGTLKAAEGRLDYLKDLGVTHIELMPLANFPGRRGWGYDGVDLYAIFNAYGEPHDLKHFVDACHGKGLAVLLDVVYNHLGPVGNYLSKFGPYFTASHSTPWGDAVNFEEAGASEVRCFLIDNALMWLRDYHMDGLRLDAVHAFNDRSAIHFLEQITREVKRLEAAMGKHFVLIAESDLNDPRIVKAEEAGGYGLDAQWSDDFHHALFSVISGERAGYYADFGSLAQLAKSLRCVFVYDGNYSEYRQRNHGRQVVGLSGHRFVGFVQNHDQVGNRAQGERVSHEAGEGRAKIAAALVLTAPFVPMLFQGEEFGASAPFLYFTDYDDPELGRMISEGRKREFVSFGWAPDQIPDPQDEQTFNQSKLNWAELTEQPHASLLQWHKDLIRLRYEWSELSDGNLNAVEVRFDEQAQWLMLERGSLRIACNLGQAAVDMEVGNGAQLLLASDGSIALSDAVIRLGSDSVAVLSVPPPRMNGGAGNAPSVAIGATQEHSA
jgi:maltooligosyltrehalose trehalohydrolase